MPDVWPAGSFLVMIDGGPEQIELAMASRGLARHYRIGPSGRSYEDPSYLHQNEAFSGIGLRPYAPVHLTASWQGGDVNLTWIRRTRMDGDTWEGVDVPLHEESERYLLRVVKGGVIQHEQILNGPNYQYTTAQIGADGVTIPFSVEVAQISQRFGAGPFRRIDINV
jgi:hypothetical protein